MPMPSPEMMGGGAPGAPVPMLPGVMQAPEAQAALQAMGPLGGGNANPTEALSKVAQAIQHAHQLVIAVIPQVQTWNYKVAKDLLDAAKKLITAEGDLKEEIEINAPPPYLGGQPGAMGLQSGSPPF